jgi:hypothetical protein
MNDEETESAIPDEDYQQISDHNLNYYTDMELQPNLGPHEKMSIDALEQ